MKRFLGLLFCVALTGCASTPNKYVSTYNEAVTNGQSVVIIKEGDFEVMRDGIDQQLRSVGYNKILYSSPTESCIALVKDVDYGDPLLNNDPLAYQIILKYTKLEAGKTRIDLVNGATKISSRIEVDKDIRKLAESIRSN